MAAGNQTTVTKFILLGFSIDPRLEVTFSVLFLVMYLLTLVGNLGMIMVIRLDSRLHTPMYFFLSHLSLMDLGYSSAVTPKMLVNSLSGRKDISWSGCVAQMYFCGLCVNTECYLLAVMAYDRYVAICNPLLYRVVMSWRVCVHLAAGSYIVATLTMSVHVSSVFTLHFCDSNVINHFFCDIPPLLKLSCSSTYINELVLFALATLVGLITLLFILISYIYILCTILRIRSAKGRHKAFSTCASHLMAVTVYYGTLSFMYLRPSSSYSLDTDKVASVFYTAVSPMMNPLIYSLRNKEVKDALKSKIDRYFSSFF
ncbi:olfactory receptor 5AR1-like [Emydura macquarii macquarii]|uniref:olfactory receptor 5AR1-like n=1 Tax=Emydura macquarii macquarii TaxID=1129001 RepID=UPI00352BC3E2